MNGSAGVTSGESRLTRLDMRVAHELSAEEYCGRRPLVDP